MRLVHKSKYITALANYLRHLFGLDMANDMLIRLLQIEQVIETNDYEPFCCHDVFFYVYFFVRRILRYTAPYNTTDKDKKCECVLNIFEYATFLSYTHFGPTTEYPMRFFVSNLNKRATDWTRLSIELCMDTPLPAEILDLNTNVCFFNKEMAAFISHLDENKKEDMQITP